MGATSMTEKILREMIREELLRIVEVAQHQDTSGHWEPEVWIGEEEEENEGEEEE